MSFDRLLHNVARAEATLEAQERRVAADWRQLESSWRAGWTPARIVIAGLVAGFLAGRATPLRHVASGDTLQLISALSGLFASAQATAASEDAAAAQPEFADA